MQQLEQDIKQWADSRWPARTLASRLRKLGEEVGELAESVVELAEAYQSPYSSHENSLTGYSLTAVNNCKRHAAREAADCAIVLSDICSLLGYSLSAVMREKFAEVRVRPSAGELKEQCEQNKVPCPYCGVMVDEDSIEPPFDYCHHDMAYPHPKVTLMGTHVPVDEMDEDPASW